MVMYGPTLEAKQVKGQEYERFSQTRDASGNKKVASDLTDGQKYATNSTGKGGVLDSVAQNHIQDLDIEKEKAILESDDIITAYKLYIEGEFEKAADFWQSLKRESQLEKRMAEDYNALKFAIGVDDNLAKKLIIDEYYGNKYISQDASDEEKAKIIKNILRMRLNYVNKITSLMSTMLRKNYKVLGLSEEQAKIYIDSLSSGTNYSVKAAGDILKLIKSNGDKFLTNNGQSVDLSSLGFGVILGPTAGYELGFAGTDMTNEDAMLNLVQTAMRYDVVVVAHGGSEKNFVDDKRASRALPTIRDAMSYVLENKDKYVKMIRKMDEEEAKYVTMLSNEAGMSCIPQNSQVKITAYITKELLKINTIGMLRSKDEKQLMKEYVSSALKAVNKFFDYDLLKEAVHTKVNDKEELTKFNKYMGSRKNIIELIGKWHWAHQFLSSFYQTQTSVAKGKAVDFWYCQPTRTLKAGPFDDVNDLVRELIKEGYKKIFIKDCNPGGHKLADDIMNTKGILINHSDFSNYVESSIIDSTDEDFRVIKEAEESLMEFAESYDINYNDDEYLTECCNWYLENRELINEGKIFDNIKEYFKRVVGAIIGFFKAIYRLIKKALLKLKELFFGTKEEPKDAKAEFQKPIKTKLIDVKSQKIVEITSKNREELNKEASEMCSKLSHEIKEFNQKQQRSLNKIEREINELSRQEVLNKESTVFDLMDSFFLEEGDLLANLELLREFEDANGPVADDEEEPSDFSMGDDAGEAAPAAETTPEEAPAEDAPEDEEFSMDDEGEQPPEENPETQEEPDDAPEDEDYEIPDEEVTEENPEGEAPAEDAPEDEEFSMDDAGEGTEGGEGTDDTAGDSMGDDTPSDDNIDPRLKDLEAVVFDNLSDKEKELKIKDLKELFITVYKKCGTISELLTDIKRDEETIQIVEYISNTLIDLKQYVNDYINDIFDSKTYVENLAQLQKYIMIFNAINKVFDQIKREKSE